MPIKSNNALDNLENGAVYYKSEYSYLDLAEVGAAIRQIREGVVPAALSAAFPFECSPFSNEYLRDVSRGRVKADPIFLYYLEHALAPATSNDIEFDFKAFTSSNDLSSLWKDLI